MNNSRKLNFRWEIESINHINSKIETNLMCFHELKLTAIFDGEGLSPNRAFTGKLFMKLERMDSYCEHQMQLDTKVFNRNHDQIGKQKQVQEQHRVFATSRLHKFILCSDFDFPIYDGKTLIIECELSIVYKNMDKLKDSDKVLYLLNKTAHVSESNGYVLTWQTPTTAPHIFKHKMNSQTTYWKLENLILNSHYGSIKLYQFHTQLFKVIGKWNLWQSEILHPLIPMDLPIQYQRPIINCECATLTFRMYPEFISTVHQTNIMYINSVPVYGPPAFCADDVTIRIGEDKMLTSRRLLTEKSFVFKAMFSVDMLESTSNIINIVDISYDVMKSVLNYMQFNERPENVDLLDVLYAAEKYQIANLRNICINEMIKTVSVENIMSYVSVCDAYCDKLLRNNLRLFMHKNTDAILDHYSFVDIQQYPQITDVLLRVPNNDPIEEDEQLFRPLLDSD